MISMWLFVATLASAEEPAPPIPTAPIPAASDPAAEPTPTRETNPPIPGSTVSFAQGSPIPSTKLDTLVLTDGQVLRGRITKRESSFSVELAVGAALVIPARLVHSVQWASGVKSEEGGMELEKIAAPEADQLNGWELPDDDLDRIPRLQRKVGQFSRERDPKRSRSIVGQTARSIGGGRGFVSQRELGATIVGVGVSEGIDLTAGAVVPSLLSEYSRLATFGAKFSVPLGPHLTTAVAGQAVVVMQQGWFSPHAILTWSGKRATYTLGAGAALNIDTADTAGLVMLSADWLLGPRVALLAEAWVLSGALPYGNSTVVMPAMAARFHMNRWSVDAGFVGFDPSFGTSGTFVPLPWLDISWSWGALSE